MRKYILTSLVGLSLISCRLDDNISPNHPSLDQVSARQRLSAAETSTYAVQASSMNLLGNVFMNSWSGNVYYFGNPLTKETNLNIDASFYQSIWNNTYISVARLQSIIDSESSKSLPYHRAIAKILKAHYMQYIVDLYNDVPYSEAFKGQSNVAAKYDKAQDVYKALVLEINEALNLIDSTSPTDANKVNPDEDVIMGGDMGKWKKFANTVKLRYLVRQSKTTDAAARAFVMSQLPTLVGASFIDFDVTINPGYSAATSSNQNPLYSAIGIRQVDGTVNTYGWRLYKASAHIANKLNGTDSGVEDPRASSLFSLRSGKVVGVVQGSPKDATKKESTFSWIGGNFMKDANEGSSMDGYLMLNSESEFLQADAAIAYPSYFSNAQQHFYKGIEASFQFHGVGDRAAGYIVAIDSKSGMGWAGSSDKLEAIQYQRWIALTNYHGIETYINYIKTGYPRTPLAENAQRANKPYRLVYPASEYTSNSANVPKMTVEDAFTINQFSPFWLK
ncbi:SusD/RagB family nutrient-binding outer membrane lipoprotein [Riemerella anatipestifer]|uniref:SusD/RagB family nutrient-binding outer membrane lipoprotein n=1 Tax=Riemerella anatipestifer TaxID=34085 RepID=UPI00129E4444|nr:SusD/RagB family nutrient-binding outer membrane lipoprotein [Riemerella anatipestifer]MRM83788.1 SusD/RagB family nutrient-binding outer membrane lipoprotein [Riemerella anatipestifer]